MGRLLDSLNHYFENTPKEILEQHWSEIKHWNEVGLDVVAYGERQKRLMKRNEPVSKPSSDILCSLSEDH